LADKKKQNTAVIINRKVKFEYFIVQEFEAGIMLKGTEVKSLRSGHAHMTDAFCAFEGNELYVRNLFISEYELGNIHNHEPKRTRKLLLKKAELKKILKRVTEKGFTVVPYKIYFNDRGFAKVQILLAQGKKSFDKRNTIKERENKRSLDRFKKEFG
jgi:SsrA-binding protein